jgi:hypothetical protein
MILLISVSQAASITVWIHWHLPYFHF